MATLKTHLVPIGNSRGIRIPLTVIRQCNLKDEVELDVYADHLVVRSNSQPRKDWPRAFATQKKARPDKMMDGMDKLRNDWDANEWEW